MLKHGSGQTPNDVRVILMGIEGMYEQSAMVTNIQALAMDTDEYVWIIATGDQFNNYPGA